MSSYFLRLSEGVLVHVNNSTGIVIYIFSKCLKRLFFSSHTKTGVYIFDFAPPTPGGGGGGEYDQKGIWGKNMKKMKRKEEEKKKKRRKKEEKKENEEKFIKQHYFFSYLRRCHQFDHVSRGVQERRVEHSIKSPFFLHYTNV
jgi:hypothetical protein